MKSHILLRALACSLTSGAVLVASLFGLSISSAQTNTVPVSFTVPNELNGFRLTSIATSGSLVYINAWSDTLGAYGIVSRNGVDWKWIRSGGNLPVSGRNATLESSSYGVLAVSIVNRLADGNVLVQELETRYVTDNGINWSVLDVGVGEFDVYSLIEEDGFTFAFGKLNGSWVAYRKLADSDWEDVSAPLSDVSFLDYGQDVIYTETGALCARSSHLSSTFPSSSYYLSFNRGLSWIRGTSASCSPSIGENASVVEGANETVYAFGRYIGITDTEVLVSDLDPEAEPSSLVNLSARSYAGTGEGTLIVGFVTEEGSEVGLPVVADELLLRGVGPALEEFGVEGVASNPRISLYHDDEALMSNDDWGVYEDSEGMDVLREATGAFALPDASLDSSMASSFRTLGSHTLHVESDEDGIALGEIFLSPDASLSLANLSCRSQVAMGDGALIGGFVVEGEIPLQVLIRGMGPSLSCFDVACPLEDPQITLYSGSDVVASNAGWAASEDAEALEAAFESTGAFTPDENGEDAALLATLAPGAYTIHVSSESGQEGVALLELYVVD